MPAIIRRYSKTGKSVSPRDHKLFGRYHEVVLLVLGFVFTTLVGGFLTYWYQERAWQRDDQSRRKQQELSRGSAVFDDVSKLLDKRLYRLRNIEWALEENLYSAEISVRREQYREVVEEWNENLNRNLALTQRYFGSDVRQELEGSITEGFRSLHSELNSVLKKPSADSVEMLKNNTNDFNPKIYLFNLRMLDALQRGEVGVFMQSGDNTYR